MLSYPLCLVEASVPLPVSLGVFGPLVVVHRGLAAKQGLPPSSQPHLETPDWPSDQP